MPANFRSYEGQLRLLTAVIASTPGLKLDYKGIAAHYGSDWTESGIEHFFRPIKKNAKAIQSVVASGHDAAQYDHNPGKSAASAGSGALGGTPRANSTDSTPKTPRTAGGRKRAVPPSSKASTTKKAKLSTPKTEAAAAADDDDSDDDIDVPAPVLTPNVNEKAMRAHEARIRLNNPPVAAAAPPSLASAQAASPDEDDEGDDDLKVITPQDAAPSFSHSHRGSQAPAPAAPAFALDQVAGSSRYDPSPFFNFGGYGEQARGQGQSAYVVDEDEDEFDV